jgi:hypothetical protein
MPEISHDYIIATLLLDGLHAHYGTVHGTDLEYAPDGKGHKATIYTGRGEHRRTIEYTSRLGWFEAAEGCVRSALWVLDGGQDEPSTGS